LTLLDRFPKKVPKINENHLIEAELFHAERRTDKPDEANSCFPKFFEST